MTDDEAQTFLRRWWEGVWRDGDIGLIDELVADRYEQHSTRGNIVLDRKEFKDRMAQYQRVLHRAVTTVDDHTIDGDRLWFRATSAGANLETGAPSLVTWLVVYRFDDDGRMTEGWVATIPDVDWR